MTLADYLIQRIRERRRRIVVIGDAMYDRWVYGLPAACQDGCVKFTRSKVHTTPGGAANAHQCLQHWDINSDLFGTPERQRPIKYRYLTDEGKIVFRYDDEQSMCAYDRAECRYAYVGAVEMIGCADAVLLSDYDKGFLTPEFIKEVAETCNRRGIPCVADCKRAPETYTGCILKCNSDWQHRHNDKLSSLVYDSVPGCPLVVTAGALNPISWDNGPRELGYDLHRVCCVNHVGAGDCFAAHLTLALAYEFSLADAAAIAHSAGRVYVQQRHNYAPHPAEIAADMDAKTPAQPATTADQAGVE